MARKKARLDKHPEPIQTAPTSSHTNWLFPVMALLIAVIPFGVGKYIEFNSPGAFDCGAYIYSAQHILQGATLGVDEMPSAQAGTLVMNILGVWLFGFNDYGPKVVQAVLQAAALLMMFFTVRKIFGRLASLVSVLIASIYLSAPLIAKYGNVKEQFMVAFAVMGICFFVRRQYGGAWWLGLASGMFLVWTTLFKETGFAVIGGVGGFVLLQPFLKNRTWKQTAADIGLLIGGAAITLVPIYAWLLIRHHGNFLPYGSVIALLHLGGAQSGGTAGDSYVGGARKMIEFSTYAARILRYYSLLILPISLAACSILLRIARLWLNRSNPERVCPYERFVLLFGIWWLLDIAFVWVSPRSFEEYYIPLNASAAMLSAYLMAIYADTLTRAVFKARWIVTGIVGFMLMILMSWHIFFGITKSPHSNQAYGSRQRGYSQRLDEIRIRKLRGEQSTWELAADYIRQNSTPTDTIFVWGWVPGIYVNAQRLSPTTKPFTSEMHVMSPDSLKRYVDDMLADFARQKPLFIVDTHKVDFPWDRPPLELWPIIQRKALPNDPRIVEQYEQQYGQMLKERISADEAQRFVSMKALRDFVMSDYRLVKSFGEMTVFELKNPVQ